MRRRAVLWTRNFQTKKCMQLWHLLHEERIWSRGIINYKIMLIYIFPKKVKRSLELTLHSWLKWWNMETGGFCLHYYFLVDIKHQLQSCTHGFSKHHIRIRRENFRFLYSAVHCILLILTIDFVCPILLLSYNSHNDPSERLYLLFTLLEANLGIYGIC